MRHIFAVVELEVVDVQGEVGSSDYRLQVYGSGVGERPNTVGACGSGRGYGSVLVYDGAIVGVAHIGDINDQSFGKVAGACARRDGPDDRVPGGVDSAGSDGNAVNHKVAGHIVSYDYIAVYVLYVGRIQVNREAKVFVGSLHRAFTHVEGGRWL